MRKKEYDGGLAGGRAISLAGMIREGEIEEELLPYEKFERLGPSALTDAELLAIIIRTGSGRYTPMQIGRLILESGGAKERGLANLYHLSTADLMKIPGIGRVKAIKLRCITELSKRISTEKIRPTLDFAKPRKVAAYYMEEMRHKDTEHLMLISLNSRLRLIASSEISSGTVNGTLASPREIYIRALSDGAVNIILLHNHPGGDPSPSRHDIESTDEICEAGRLLKIRLLDHLIIGDGCYYSFSEHGLMKI